ncbi:hypothetical protein DFQ29_001443, partial [Apophysomyces sp. BC1021]
MAQKVETAGGHQTHINRKANIMVSLGGYMDNIDAYIFLTKFDLILGHAWIQTVQPCTNWQTDCWHFYKNDKEYMLQLSKTKTNAPQLDYLISAKQIEKSVAKQGAECYLIHLQDKVEKQPQTV